MGLGMMIGAGVFVGIGLCMGEAGPGGLMLTFALNGLIALFSAMSFAELASAIPKAGGTYNFARIAFGRPASFVAGWIEWLAASAAGGFYALVLSKYTLEFFAQMGWIDEPGFGLVRVCAVFAALAFVYVNFRGSSETGKLGAIFTVGQMAFVLAIGAIGAFQFFRDPARIENFQPFLGNGSWLKLLGSMGLIYVAFEGFEVIAQAGDETIEPGKNIPKAILYSVLIVTFTYLLVGFGVVVAIKAGTPVTDSTGQVTDTINPVWQWIGGQGAMGFRGAVKILLGGWGGLLVTLAVIFSATSALNATIYSATRTSYALGRDRMLPAVFSKIHHKTRTPWFALLVTSLLVLGIIIVVSIKDGSATASMMFLLLFFLVNICVIRIRRNMGDELEYGYLMPLFPLFPILAILLQMGLAFGILEESIVAWLIAALWIPAGVVIYFVYSTKNAIITADEIHVFHDAQAARPEDMPEASGGEYRVMVAVANPDSALQLVQNTYNICRAQANPHVEIIHMVPVPDQVPLSDADKYMSEGREAIMETMLSLGPMFPVSTTLRYCRNCARGIVSAIRQKRTNLLIMGWHGRHRAHGFHLGSTVDPILENAPCHVVMFKNCGGNRRYKRILVPLAGGPNSALALEMASILADPEEGRVTALTVTGGDRKFDLAGFVEQHRSRIVLPADRVHCKTVAGKDVVKTILRQAEDYDMVVIGNTHESVLRQMTHTPIPETVARHCAKPLVTCRAASGLRSWIRRYL